MPLTLDRENSNGCYQDNGNNRYQKCIHCLNHAFTFLADIDFLTIIQKRNVAFWTPMIFTEQSFAAMRHTAEWILTSDLCWLVATLKLTLRVYHSFICFLFAFESNLFHFTNRQFLHVNARYCIFFLFTTSFLYIVIQVLLFCVVRYYFELLSYLFF